MTEARRIPEWKGLNPIDVPWARELTAEVRQLRRDMGTVERGVSTANSNNAGIFTALENQSDVLNTVQDETGSGVAAIVGEPTVPTLNSGAGTISAEWDGQYIVGDPANPKHIGYMVAEATTVLENPDPEDPNDTFVQVGSPFKVGGTNFLATDIGATTGDTVYVRFRAYTVGGVSGIPGEPNSIAVSGVSAGELDPAIIDAIQEAQDTADSKTKVYYGTGPADTSVLNIGDILESDEGTKVWNGTAWVFPGYSVPKAPTGLAEVSNVGGFVGSFPNTRAESVIKFSWSPVTESMTSEPLVVDEYVFQHLIGESWSTLAVVPASAPLEATVRVPSGSTATVRVYARTGAGTISDPSATLTRTGAVPAASAVGTITGSYESDQGTVAVYWNGQINGSGTLPAEFSHVKGKYHLTGVTPFSLLPGNITRAGQVGTIVESVGSTGTFVLEAYDVLGRIIATSAAIPFTVQGIKLVDIDQAFDDYLSGIESTADNAQASADGKNTNYYQPAAPTGGTYRNGDLWFDTDDGNKVYVRQGSAWVDAQDDAIQQALSDASSAQAAANSAQVSANGKNTNYYQAAAPTGGTYRNGDLWFDTDDGNRIYMRQGAAWIDAQDDAIQSAMNQANSASSAAAAAQTTANGKNKVVRSPNDASTPANYVNGDQWWKFSGSQIVAMWIHNGTSWVSQTLTDSVITNLDAGTITAGTLNADRIAANSLTIGKVNGLQADLNSKETPAGSSAKVAAAEQRGVSRGTDLVTNGTGLLGDNTNFSAFIYDPMDAPAGARGSFVAPAGLTSATLDEFIPVSPSKPYRLSIQARQRAAGSTGRLYAGLVPMDAGNASISPYMYYYRPETMTTLAAPLNPGDTTVTVSNAAEWISGGARYIGLWNWKDSNGRVWPAATYTRNVLIYTSISGNVITLSGPYTGQALPAGSPVSENLSGGTYMYLGAVNSLIPETWTEYSGSTQIGVHDGSTGTATTRFPPGTASAKVIILPNRTSAGPLDPSSDHAVAAVSLSDASAANRLLAEWTATGTTEINGGKIVTDSIVAGTLKAWTVAAGQAIIADATITNAKIANLDAAKITTGFLSSARIAAKSVSVEKLMIGSFDNLIPDPTLAGEIVDYWNPAVGPLARWAMVWTAGLPGRALTAIADGTELHLASRNTIAVKPGQKFAIGARAQTTGWAGGSPRLSMVFRNAAGGYVTAVTGRIIAGVWADYSGIIEVPNNEAITQANWEIQVPASATGGQLWVGKPTWREAVTGELIVDGAVTADKVAANAITAAKIDAGAVTADKIAVNAVTANKIAAGTITSDKIAVKSLTSRQMIIGDSANMAELNESYPGSVAYGDWSATIVDGWSARAPLGGASAQYFMFRNQGGPLPFKTGDRIRMTFEAYSASGAAITAAPLLWTYPDTASSQAIGASASIGTTPVLVEREADVTIDTAGKSAFLVGLVGSDLINGDLRVRNVRVYRMGAGELIVDGSILAKHIEMDTAFANKFWANEGNFGKIKVNMVEPSFGEQLNLNANEAVQIIVGQQAAQAGQIGDAQNAANNAQNAANAANDAAGTAQSTANTAQSAANTAQGTANTALNKAEASAMVYRFTNTEAIIGREGSPSSMHLTETGIQLRQGAEVRAEISQGFFIADRLEAKVEVVIGKHKFETSGTSGETVIRALG